MLCVLYTNNQQLFLIYSKYNNSESTYNLVSSCDRHFEQTC